MTRTLVISADAVADLVEIGEHIGAYNPARARSFVAELRAHARTVAGHAESYRIRAEFGAGIRAVGYRDYMIFYRVTPSQMRVLRIMHGSRDLSGLTFD